MAVTDEDREKFLELLDEFGSDISEARKLQDNEIQDALMLPGSKTDGESGQQEYVTVTYGQVKGSGGGVQIVNNLVDGGINKALSAEMGKTLKGMIDQGGGGGQGTVKGAKVGSGSTISPDSNGIVTLPNYAENATKVESSSTNGNIKINGTETKVFEMPSSDPYTTARTPLSHSHGNIANGGTLSDTAADAAGNDRLVIRDADNNKIQTSTIKGTDVADAVSKKHSHSNKSVLDSITQEKMESWDNASSGGVTNVSYNGTAKAITKTVGGQTTEVVSASTLKADMGLTKSDIGLGNVTNDAQVKRSEMGVANGVATLGSDGKVPSIQLPAISAAQYTQKVFLEENGGVLTQAMVNTQNTIYVIQHDYIISANITIPAGCMLEFAGGSLRNGQDGSFKITSTNTYVKNYTIDCISNLLVVNGFIPVESNTHNNGKPIYTLECFGDYRSDALAVFNLAIHNSLNRIVYVNEDITINQNGAVLNVASNYTTLASQNNSKITFTGHITFNASSYLTIKDIHLHFDTPAQTDQLFVADSNHIIIENIEMSGTVKEVEGQIQRFGGGIHVIQCLNTIIRKNRIHDVFLNGILVHNDCIYIDIIDNFVDGSTNIGIEIEGRSGSLGTTEAHPCSNITIIGNQLYNCADCGININFSNTVNIVGNIVKYTRIGLNCISCQDVAISSNYVISNGSALLIDQEFFGDISLTNRNITVSDNTFSGGITNNLTGQGKVINALVPIQNAANVKLTNNTFAIHSLVDTRTKDNDCVIAILSSTGVKVLNNQITGYVDNLPAKYNTGILIGRSYKVQQTTNYYEITDELQQIPSDIKIANNTIGYLAYGISTIIPNSTDITPYTDGVENKVNQLQVYKNTIKNCTYDINIGYYAVDWKIEDNMLVDNDHNNYPSSGATSETPQVMKGAVKGAGYFNTSMEKQTFWSGKRWVNAVGKIIPRRIAYFGNSLLLGFGYGMAATAADKDYYYLVNKYLKGGYPDVNTTRIDARGFETAESDTQADSGMWPLMEYIMQGAQAVIIQCGDNVDTIARQSYFTQYGAKRLLHTIRQYLPDVKIYWVGLWFDKTAVYNAIVHACEEEGANLVDIRDLYSPENLSSIGAVRRYDESTTYTKHDVTNVSADGDSITITFHVYQADYTATIEVSSYSLSGTTLTFTGYETYIDDYGESIHPSDEGFSLIANRILGALVKDFAIPFDALSSKQDKLVSGVNIKTINNQSILGSGNITIQGGGGTAQYTQKVFLEENGGVLTQAMVNTANTIYVIQYGYNLNDPNGQNPIRIPANCVLEFAGGSLSNGTIVFNNTEVLFEGKCIASDCNIEGTITNNRVPIDHFITDYSDCTDAFTKLIDFLELGNGGQILLSAKTYTVSSINLGIKTSIIGCGYGSSIIRTNVTTETAGGIINIPRSTTCCTIYGVSIVGSQIIDGNIVANQNIDGINVALTYGISGDTLYSRQGNFENETTEEDFNRVASYKNITIDNVYVGHCRNGIVIYRHGFRTNIINSEIKFNYEDGIKCHATDNIFYNLYVEGNGKNGINYTDNSSDNKISNIKSIFNGNSDPKNCYAYRISSSILLVNCESQDNACSGFLLAGDSNQLINCTSNHDCLTDTDNIHYDASKELVGFRIAGSNNILKMCSVLSYTNSDRTYHKFYEVLDALNTVDIKIPTELYMDNNPVDSLVRVPTDLGNVQDLLSDEGGIYISYSRRTVLQKKIVLPGVFMYVVDVDIPTLEEIEGVNGNYPQIMDIAGIRSQIYTSEDNVVIATVGENFKKNGESITIIQTNPISVFDFSNEIRIAVMVDCINKKIYSYYSFKVADAGWIAIGRTFKEFDTYTPLQLTATIGDNFNKTSFKSDLRIKRFAIGYDPDASFETLSRLGMPILMSQNFMSYDYANEVAIEGSILSTNGTVRPTSPIGGQMFFDKNLNKPVWWSETTSDWVGSTGNEYTQKVFLEENGGVLTQAMVNMANTIYVIQYDYNLNDPNGQNPIHIPANCVLEFAGGSLDNGVFYGNKCKVLGTPKWGDNITYCDIYDNDGAVLYFSKVTNKTYFGEPTNTDVGVLTNLNAIIEDIANTYGEVTLVFEKDVTYDFGQTILLRDNMTVNGNGCTIQFHTVKNENGNWVTMYPYSAFFTNRKLKSTGLSINEYAVDVLYGEKNITIKNINFTFTSESEEFFFYKNSERGMIAINSASNIRVENCTFNDVYKNYPIWVTDVDGIVVEGCEMTTNFELHDNRDTCGLLWCVSGYVWNVEVAHNKAVCYNDEVVCVSNLSGTLKVHDNDFTSIEQVSVTIQEGASPEIYIEKNIFSTISPAPVFDPQEPFFSLAFEDAGDRNLSVLSVKDNIYNYCYGVLQMMQQSYMTIDKLIVEGNKFIDGVCGVETMLVKVRDLRFSNNYCAKGIKAVTSIGLSDAFAYIVNNETGIIKDSDASDLSNLPINNSISCTGTTIVSGNVIYGSINFYSSGYITSLVFNGNNCTHGYFSPLSNKRNVIVGNFFRHHYMQLAPEENTKFGNNIVVDSYGNLLNDSSYTTSETDSRLKYHSIGDLILVDERLARVTSEGYSFVEGQSGAE